MGEWVKCSDRLPDRFGGVYRVKLENGNQILAYWNKDRMERLMWRLYTNITPSHWWSKDDPKPLYDVAEWYEFKEANDD